MYVSHLLLFTLEDPLKSLSAGNFSWRTKVRPSSLKGPAFWWSPEDQVQGRHLTKGYFLCPHLCNVDIDFDYLFLLTASLVKGTLSCFFCVCLGKQWLFWSLRGSSLCPGQPHGESLQCSPSLRVLGKDWPALPPALFPLNDGGIEHLPGTLGKRTSWL